MRELGIVFLIFLLIAGIVTGCSKKTVPIYSSKAEEEARKRGSTVWLNIPDPPMQPGLNYKPDTSWRVQPDKVVQFNAATDNNGNPIDTSKVYITSKGTKYTWKIAKSGKPYKRYFKN